MKYERVEEVEDVDLDEEEEGMTDGFRQNTTTPKKKSQIHGRFLSILVIENVLLIFILLFLWRIFSTPRTHLRYQVLTGDNKTFPTGPLSWSKRFEALPCGKTPQEAKARGCQFDMLVTAWLPPRCIDQDLVQEFLELGSWDFYNVQDGTQKDRMSTYDAEFLGSVNTTILIESI